MAETVATGDQAKSVAGGFLWTSLGNALVQLIQFVTLVALARILTPSAFGEAAVVAVVVAFAQLLTDLGLASALIQIRNLSHSDVVSAFWTNSLAGAILTGGTWALSSPVAQVFRHAEIGSLLRLASLTFVASAGVVQLSLLERSRQFRKIILIEAVAAAVGAAAAIVSAEHGAGASSIILGPLVTSGSLSVILWVVMPFNPFGWLSADALRRLWDSGAGVAGFNILTFWARNSDNILLGRFASAADLGFYSRAYNIMMAPIAQVNVALSRVLFPSLARLRGRPDLMGAEYLSAIRLAAVTMFPTTLLVACLAHPISVGLLGSAWAPMTWPLCLLAASGPAQVLGGTAGSVYQACGQGGSLLRRGGFLAAASVIATIAGLPWGGVGISAALLVRFYVLLPLTMARPLQLAGLSWRPLIVALRGVCLASAGLASTVLLLQQIGFVVRLWAVLVDSLAGLCVYAALLWLFDRVLIERALSLIPARRRDALRQ